MGEYIPGGKTRAMTSALRAARTIDEFNAICAALIEESPFVSVDESMLHVLDDTISNAAATNWSWMHDARSVTPAELMFDLAFNASLNGGYFELDSTGAIRQWQLGGSGSSALTRWFEDIRAEGLLPGRDIRTPAEAAEKLAPHVAGLPYAEERLDVCRQFADRSRRTRLEDLVASQIDGNLLRCDLAAADRLAEIYPAGLKADPFRKKAILAWLLLAGVLAHRGYEVEWKAGLPIDYQIPRALLWKGILRPTEKLTALLKTGDALIDIEGDGVTHLRAATAVAVELLARRTGVAAWLIDGAIFNGFRKDPAFQASSLPPMKTNGSWF